METKAQTNFTTPLGQMYVEGGAKGVTKIWMENGKARNGLDPLPEALKEPVCQLKAYFNGELKTFSFKTNPSGTAFQQKVWTALREIPYGKTLAYKQLAQNLGDLKAIRAIAAANGKNPLPIVVPCHRVIGSDGGLTGYASGLWRKKWLLEHESPSQPKSLF